MTDETENPLLGKGVTIRPSIQELPGCVAVEFDMSRAECPGGPGREGITALAQRIADITGHEALGMFDSRNGHPLVFVRNPGIEDADQVAIGAQLRGAGLRHAFSEEKPHLTVANQRARDLLASFWVPPRTR